ncbi:MAG: DUF1330 domain-containing protein [Pseudomonadota bacterium]
MPKGYWIAHAEVTDPTAWQAYVTTAKAAFEEHGAVFLARGGAAEELEGAAGRSRHVVIEFPSLEAAKACWQSDTYQAARKAREGAGQITITVTEGLG